MILALVALLVFLSPTQIGLHLWPDWAFLQGLSVDYLSPTLYLTDIFLILLILLQPWLLRHQLIFFLLFFTFLNTVWSFSPPATLIAWAKTLLFFSFFLTLSRFSLSRLKLIFPALSLAVIYSSTLALLQFIRQGSLNGLTYYLGERRFTLSTPDIAKIDLPGLGLRLRAYSSFSHPNSLAGYLLIALILLLLGRQIFPRLLPRWFHYLTLTLGLVGILLTFSKTAIFLLLLLPIFFLGISPRFFRWLLITTFILLLVAPLLYRLPLLSTRTPLLQASLPLVIDRPFLGWGLNNFLPALVNRLPLWPLQFRQPVHHLWLLLAVEVGLPLTLLLLFRLFRLTRQIKLPLQQFVLFALLVTSSLDHYWLTLPQNRLLFIMAVSLLMVKYPRDHPHRSNRRRRPR